MWVGLLAAMTGAGALLLAVDGRPVPHVDGQALPVLAAAEVVGRSELAPVFQTRSSIERGRWQAIVIHHSSTSQGSPASLGTVAQQAGIRGLGHHFVIGNGLGMGDGEIHVTYRWLDQLAGAHVPVTVASSEWYNQNAISICLVGDGNRRPFTAGQLERLNRLVSALQQELKVPNDRVILLQDIAPVADPGRFFPAAEFRDWIAR